jgi:hypothetical protein
MAMSYHRILGDHLADHLIYPSSSSSFWFSLNSSYEHEFHLSKQLGTSRPAGCCIASLHPLIVGPSCPALSIAVALTLAPSTACRRRPVRRRCRCRRQAVAAVALLRCRHRRCHRHRAAVKLPPTSRCRAAATAADAAAAAAPPPSCQQCRAVALPQPLLLPRCCHRAAAVSMCAAFALWAGATVALSRCRHHRAAAKLLPTSRCCAAATAAVAMLLPPGCRRYAVSRYRRRVAAKLPPPSRYCAAAIAATAAAAATLPFVGWMLRCCPPPDFVIACRHATVNALVAWPLLPIIVFHRRHRRHHRHRRCRWAATTTTATTVVELTVVH